jgi:hypothetical protein
MGNVFVHVKYWLCICVALLELFCACSRLVFIVYMCCPSWVMLCLFTPSIDYVYVLPVFLCLFTPSIDCVFVFPVLSYFVFVHAKYWLCICAARLELFCVCSRLVLIVYMCCPSWVILCLFTPILGVNKHTIIQNGQRKYTINTWREQTQNNSRRATHIHNQY